jgi:hypothetical protein
MDSPTRRWAIRALSPTPSSYPGLKVVVSPSVYVVTTRTPAEFIQVLKRLQGRADLDWVEPTVTYEPAATSNNAQ